MITITNARKVLLIIGLLLLSVQAKAANSSLLSCLTESTIGKAISNNKVRTALCAYSVAKLCYAGYRNYPKLAKYYQYNDGLTIPAIVRAAVGVVALQTLWSTETSTKAKSLAMLAYVAEDYLNFKDFMNNGLLRATTANDNNAVGEFIKGFGVCPDKKVLGKALAATSEYPVAQQLTVAGAATTSVGHTALVQNFPDLAKQTFMPRHNALIAQLSQPATIISKTTGSSIKLRLPQDVAEHIASFVTGISVNTAHALDKVLGDSLAIRP